MAKDLAVYYRTEKDPSPVTLLVRPEAKAKMDAYVRQVPTEVGWMGFIHTYERHDEDHNIAVPGLLVLEDVFLYEQEVTGGSVDSGIKANINIGNILQQLIDDGKADQINELRFFAHSHANMGVYHSPVDIDMINDWAATGLEWFISHVQNKRGEVDCRLDVFLPFRMSTKVTEVVVADNELEAAVAAEIDKLVTVKTFQKQQTRWTNSPKSNQGNINSGRVISDEAKSQTEQRVMGPSAGTVDKPFIVIKSMDVGNNSKDIRQEIVGGVIIHEAVCGSPAACSRIQMTTAEKWAYYKEYMSENPSLVDPTPEQLAQHTETEKPVQSRSISRSEIKRTSDQEEVRTEETSQTQSQEEVKSDSGTSVADSSQDKKQGSKEKHMLTEEEQQQSLIVVEDDEDTPEEVQRQIAEAFQSLGFAI